ncbi:MAG: ComEC family competence protein [Candidatus Omnitrophica bacterium]|nr:ComEC family competence protein [Candidatus Omnitrophota bacterium]
MYSYTIKRPLCFCVFCFAAGIVLGRILPVSWKYIFVFSYLNILIFSFWRNCIVRTGLLMILLVSAGILAWKYHWTLPSCHIKHCKNIIVGKVYEFRGWVSSLPQIKEDKTIFLFELSEVSSRHIKYKTKGRIKVFLKDRKQVSYGQELILEGKLRYLYFFRRQSRESKNEIFLSVDIPSALLIKPTGLIKGNWLLRQGFLIRNYLAEIFKQNLSSLSADIASAMVLGIRYNLPRGILYKMAHLGTVHVLVVSGFHVGIVYAVVSIFFKLVRLTKNTRMICCLISLWIYFFITGGSTPTLRATIMASTYHCAYWLRRQADSYQTLALAALIILMIRPLELFEIGFQLSFASVLGILLFYPRLNSLFHLREIKYKFIKKFFSAFFISLSAWLGTCGIIVYNFGYLPLRAIVVSPLVVVLAALITVSNMCLLAANFVSPCLVKGCVPVIELLINFFVKVHLFFS